MQVIDLQAARYTLARYTREGKMSTLEKFTLKVMHTQRTADGKGLHSVMNWPAYIGDPIPEGLAVCRVNRAGTSDLGSNWWIVHIRSRHPVTVTEFKTRKVAVYACERIAEKWPTMDWTQTAKALTRETTPDGEFAIYSSSIHGVMAKAVAVMEGRI